MSHLLLHSPCMSRPKKWLSKLNKIKENAVVIVASQIYLVAREREYYKHYAASLAQEKRNLGLTIHTYI
jgi:hypothetical protein